MKDESHERCMSLCDQAAVEQDPARLVELMKQINHLLEERRLNEMRHKIAENENRPFLS